MLCMPYVMTVESNKVGNKSMHDLHRRRKVVLKYSLQFRREVKLVKTREVKFQDITTLSLAPTH